jgi:hypothetical protein
MPAKFSKLARTVLTLVAAISLMAGTSSKAFALDNFEVGKGFFAKKDFRSAKVYFDKAAADMPWDSNVLYYQALTSQYLKDWEGSKRVYKKIVEQFPGTDAEHNSRAALNVLEPGWEKKAKAESAAKAGGTQAAAGGASAKSGASSGDLPPVSIDAPASSRVPLVRTGDRVFIDVSVNGRSKQMEYAGDETSVNLKDAIALGIVDKAKPPAAGTKIPVTFKMSQITQKNFPLNIGSDSDRTKVGDDFFKKFNINLDPSGITAAYRQASARKSGGYDLPFRNGGNGQLMVDVSVNGRRVSMAFDEKAGECIVPSARAREFGLDVQETSETNMWDAVKNPTGPVRGDPGYGEVKKNAFAEARIQVGPVTSTGIRVKIDDQAKGAVMGPSAFSGWHADVDKPAGVIHLSR